MKNVFLKFSQFRKLINQYEEIFSAFKISTNKAVEK